MLDFWETNDRRNPMFYWLIEPNTGRLASIEQIEELCMQRRRNGTVKPRGRCP
jgi:hypothetical protein